MKESKLESIELTLVSEGITTEYQFEGQLLGEAVFTAEDEEYSPQELIQIYQRKDGKFVSYMEYSDNKDGIWESKVYVTNELKLAEIKEGLTRANYNFGGLQIENVPSEILRTAVYHAVEELKESL